MNRARLSIFLLLAGASFTLASCMSHGRETMLDVDAEVASVTLGDDCAQNGERGAGPPADEDFAGACAEDAPCPGWCTQTGVRLSVRAAETGEDVPFEVLRVRMYTMDGQLVEELDGRNPRRFTEEGYVDWDEMVFPGADLSVSYDLNAPNWEEIGNGNAWETYGMSFRIEVDVRIDGVEQTLEFDPATREPEVVT